jgi:serine/threonine protein kinase
VILPPGSEFAGHRIERILGRGGMSEVYLVHREGSPEPETLKILDAAASQSEAIRRKFVAEAELGVRLRHRNIVAVHAHGDCDGRLWMSMHYVDGYSAARLVARGQIPMDVLRAARIVDEVSHALDHAHGVGVVHRDVKPANILISTVVDPGELEQVLLSDWGIARMVDERMPLVSDDGTVLASIGYAAPELLRGETLTARTDIYALGATLVELLTGRTPFPLPTQFAVMNAHLTRIPPDISTRRADLPRTIDAVVHRAMAKDPADRFGSCHDMSVAVARALEGYVPPPPPLRPWYRRR